jgi:hypothetical protein
MLAARHPCRYGFQLGCASNEATDGATTSQFGRVRAKIATAGVSTSGASSVPSVTVKNPGIPEFEPNSGLPHLPQKSRVTVFPASLVKLKLAGLPVMLTPLSANIAPEVWPAPLSL